MEVGFIGLGRMGQAMAHNIARAGHRVRAWNRSRVDSAAADGLEIVGTPAEALQGDAAVTMLSDDAAIRDVLLRSNALKQARRGLVHVVSSTVSVDFADELRASHAEAGIGYVAAPVFGRPDVAEAAQLTVIAAGPRQQIERVAPLLDAIGRKTWIMGEDPKQANVAKIGGNMLIAMAIEAMGEARVLAESNGLPPQLFFDLILDAQFGCRVYQNYSAKIVAGDYEPGFRMVLGLKDVRLAAAAGERSGRRLPMLDALRGQMTRAVEAGFADRDWSAVAEFTRQSTA